MLLTHCDRTLVVSGISVSLFIKEKDPCGLIAELETGRWPFYYYFYFKKQMNDLENLIRMS